MLHLDIRMFSRRMFIWFEIGESFWHTFLCYLLEYNRLFLFLQLNEYLIWNGCPISFKWIQNVLPNFREAINFYISTFYTNLSYFKKKWYSVVDFNSSYDTLMLPTASLPLYFFQNVWIEYLPSVFLISCGKVWHRQNTLKVAIPPLFIGWNKASLDYNTLQTFRNKQFKLKSTFALMKM